MASGDNEGPRPKRSRLVEQQERRKAKTREDVKNHLYNSAVGVVSVMARHQMGAWSKWADAGLTLYGNLSSAYEEWNNGGDPAVAWLVAHDFVDCNRFFWFREDDLLACEREFPVLESVGDGVATEKKDEVPAPPLWRASKKPLPRMTVHEVGGKRLCFTRATAGTSAGLFVAWQDGVTERDVEHMLAGMLFSARSSETGVRVSTLRGFTVLTPLAEAPRTTLSEDEAALLKRVRAFAAQDKTRSILLWGDPGVGKTTQACAMCHALNPGGKIVAVDGSCDNQALATVAAFVRSGLCAGVLLDDYDRQVGSAVDLLTLLHDLRGKVMVFLTANDVTVLDPAAIRSGRFDEILEVKAPSTDSLGRLLIECANESILDGLVAAWKNGLETSMTGWSYADAINLIERLNVLGVDDETLRVELRSIELQRALSSGDRTRAFLRGLRGKTAGGKSPSED
jgi:hypothetical protein